MHADGLLVLWFVSPFAGALLIAAIGAHELLAEATPGWSWLAGGLGFALWAALPFLASGAAFACCTIVLAPLAGAVFFVRFRGGGGGDDWWRGPEPPPPEPEWWDGFVRDFWRYVEERRRAPVR